MGDANEERMHVEGIKGRCNPSRFNEQTMMVLCAMVEKETGVREPSLVRELTGRFLQEAYAGLAGRGMDDRCFDSDERFMRALVLETMARAQEYDVSAQIETQLPDRGRGMGNR